VLLAMTTSAPATAAEPEQKKAAPRKPQPQPVEEAVEPDYAEEDLPELAEQEETEAPEPFTAPIKPVKASDPAPAATKKPARKAKMVIESDPLVAIAQSEPVAPFTMEPIPTPTQTRFVAKQEEMQFEAPTRGRFEKTHETIYNGENLDHPTFRRRNLVIKL
jgi:cell division protein FtsZ